MDWSMPSVDRSMDQPSFGVGLITVDGTGLCYPPIYPHQQCCSGPGSGADPISSYPSSYPDPIGDMVRSGLAKAELDNLVQLLDDDKFDVRQAAAESIRNLPPTTQLLSSLGAYFDSKDTTVEQKSSIRRALHFQWAQFLSQQVFAGSGEIEVDTPLIYLLPDIVIDATTKQRFASKVKAKVNEAMIGARLEIGESVGKFLGKLDKHGTNFLGVPEDPEPEFAGCEGADDAVLQAMNAATVKNPGSILVLRVSLSFSGSGGNFSTGVYNGTVNGEYRIYIKSGDRIGKEPVSQGKVNGSGQVKVGWPE